jgi:hypothetical protein
MSHLGTLPTSPSVMDAKLQLYTRNNRDVPQDLSYLNAGSLGASNFDATLPIKFVTHGFNENGASQWILGVKDAYLDRVCKYGTANGSSLITLFNLRNQ